jgi:hypothetical protein
MKVLLLHICLSWCWDQRSQHRRPPCFRMKKPTMTSSAGSPPRRRRSAHHRPASLTSALASCALLRPASLRQAQPLPARLLPLQFPAPVQTFLLNPPGCGGIRAAAADPARAVLLLAERNWFARINSELAAAIQQLGPRSSSARCSTPPRSRSSACAYTSGSRVSASTSRGTGLCVARLGTCHGGAGPWCSSPS